MKQIKILKSPDGNYQKGFVYDVGDERARQFVLLGYAEIVEKNNQDDVTEENKPAKTGKSSRKK